MDFSKALEAMKAEKKISRKGLYGLDISFEDYPGWKNKALVLTRNDGTKKLNYEVDSSDLLATDWEIVEDIPETKVKTLKEPLGIIFPSLKINTTLQSGTVYIKNNISPLSGELFFKIDPTIQAINEFKEWLRSMVISSENHINNAINNKRYSEVSDYAIELSVYKQCLAKLGKTLV